jgi:hypothetical protein
MDCKHRTPKKSTAGVLVRAIATDDLCNRGQVLGSSIKGKVKKNTSPAAGYFPAFQPV